MATGSVATFVRFSIGMRGRDPAEALRELNARNVVFRLEPLSGRSIDADIVVHSRPRLRIMHATLAGVSHGAAPAVDTQDDGDELLVATTLSGTSVLQQRGGLVSLTDGGGVLLRRSDGCFTLTHPDRVRFLGLRIPASAVSPFVRNVDDAMMKPIPSDSIALRLLAAYLPALAEHQLLEAPAEQAVIERHIHDLVALLCGATGDAAMMAAHRGARGARFWAMRADIMANLDEPALNASWMAARHHVTPRYVHKLFESSGSTFSHFALERRLAHVYRNLVDPRVDHLTVSEVAFAAGFGDLSYFNRSFRRRYGATPSDIRRQRPSLR